MPEIVVCEISISCISEAVRAVGEMTAAAHRAPVNHNSSEPERPPHRRPK